MFFVKLRKIPLKIQVLNDKIYPMERILRWVMRKQRVDCSAIFKQV